MRDLVKMHQLYQIFKDTKKCVLIGEDPELVFLVGRKLNERKGIHELIKAWRRFRKRCSW